ncbi:MAG: alpha/beta hydrolase [Cyclobacteriaceae bacterium]|nr:alpha/beta hydrolase [Cyclobacteriaceae bacterium]
MVLTKNTWRWLLTSVAIFSLLLLMDSCLQFRMSKSEIDTYFKDKETKGVLKQYDRDKRRLTYLITGDSTKPLVVFVHGSPGSLSAFIDFMADTALLKLAQLITVDRPGFGASNFGSAEPSLIKQVSLLEPILRERKKNRSIILVGHSLGAPFIARMAIDYPELVDGLVMVAPSIAPELEPYEWFRGPMATPFIKWLLPRSIRASNDEIYQLKPQLLDMLPLWKKITVPTIVIQGTKDSLVDPGNADFAKKMIVHAPVKLVMIEGMDHFIPWRAPNQIRECIIELLNAYQTR